MDKNKYLLFALLLLFSQLNAQFPPAAGEEGSSAIHKDSSVLVAWANACLVERGYIKVSDTSLTFEGSNRATLGDTLDALNMADGSVVSLGDGGWAVLSFENPIRNGEGPDFAVFENGFPSQDPPDGYFLELAFVEVSSDGQHFVRFPAISNTQTDTQVSTFGHLEPEKIHNLAGKYVTFYGTPFDLEDIKDSSGVDIQNITHVKIIDVVGSVFPAYAGYDAAGTAINDPWPTPFGSGGFDLDAVGVIHQGNDPSLGLEEPEIILRYYPNPVSAGDLLQLDMAGNQSGQGPVVVRMLDMEGRTILLKEFEPEKVLEIPVPEYLQTGIYFIQAGQQGRISCFKLQVKFKP